MAQLAELPKANKPRTHDNSALFKCVGGQYHDVTIRVFLPHEPLELAPGEIYEVHPPLGGRSKAMIYLKTESR